MSNDKVTMSARTTKLDRLDHKILAALQREGRITKTQLSAEVGLSATRCWERMKALERAGIIRGYHADIDLRRLARLSLFQVHVRLFDTTSAKCRQFEQLIARFDDIISCHAVLGTIDYVMLVAAPDVETFQITMDELCDSNVIRFDFVTFPVSRHIKSVEKTSIMELIKSA